MYRFSYINKRNANTSSGIDFVFVFPLGILTSVKPWSFFDIRINNCSFDVLISIVKCVFRSISCSIYHCVSSSKCHFILPEINFVDETVRTLAGNGTKGSDYKGGGQGTDQAWLDFSFPATILEPSYQNTDLIFMKLLQGK